MCLKVRKVQTTQCAPSVQLVNMRKCGHLSFMSIHRQTQIIYNKTNKHASMKEMVLSGQYWYFLCFEVNSVIELIEPSLMSFYSRQLTSIQHSFD